MSLIKCPECGNEVSDGAASCPKCGLKKPAQEAVLRDADPVAKTAAGVFATIGTGIVKIACGSMFENKITKSIKHKSTESLNF